MNTATGTAEIVELKDLPPENMKGEQKPWTFKKQENGKFKVYDRETGIVLEGFENQEFDSPLVGGRFISAILRAADEAAKKATEGFVIAVDLMKHKPEQVGDVPKKTIDMTGVDASDAQKVARHIEKGLADEHEEAADEKRIITKLGVKRMFKIIIPKQTNSDSNKPVFVPNHEGGKDWWMERGIEHIVPEYVVNILKESIATSTSYEFETNVHGVKAVPTVDRIPRFSLQILEEIRV